MALDGKPDRAALLRRGVRLEYFTIAWMVVEAAVSIGAGWLAGSIALIAFGLDSLIELVSGGVLLYRLEAEGRGASDEATEELERRALWVVGVTFFLLTAYILYEAGSTLWRRESPEASAVGIAVAVAALIVMPLLARAKHRVGMTLSSGALVADAKETIVCAYITL